MGSRASGGSLADRGERAPWGRQEYNVGVSDDRQRLRVTVPTCGCELVIDAATGAVLSHQPPAAAPAGGKDFESLLAEVDSGKARAAELFERERSALKDKDRLMEAKFEEALKRAREAGDDDEPPPRPWDLD